MDGRMKSSKRKRQASEKADSSLDLQEQHLTDIITTSATGAWARSEAYYSRSLLYSSQKRHPEALKDSRASLTLFSTEGKYLLRAVQTLLAAGHREAANRALDAAREAIQSQALSENNDSLAQQLSEVHARLRSFDIIPTEILAEIFKKLYEDDESIRYPLAITHVCSAWRNAARSTQTLWRDTRRFSRTQNECPAKFLVPALEERENIYQVRSSISRHPKHRKLLEWLALCADLSGHSLTHVELNCANFPPEQQDIVLKECLQILHHSHRTLQHLAIQFDTRTDPPSGCVTRQWTLNHVEGDDVLRERVVPCLTSLVKLLKQCSQLREFELTLPVATPKDFERFVSLGRGIGLSHFQNGTLEHLIWRTCPHTSNSYGKKDFASKPQLWFPLQHGCLRCELPYLIRGDQLRTAAQTLVDLTIDEGAIYDCCSQTLPPGQSGATWTPPFFPRLRRLVVHAQGRRNSPWRKLRKEWMPEVAEVHGPAEFVESLLDGDIRTATLLLDDVVPKAQRLTNVETLTLIASRFYDSERVLDETLQALHVSPQRERSSGDESPWQAQDACPNLRHLNIIAQEYSDEPDLIQLPSVVLSIVRDRHLLSLGLQGSSRPVRPSSAIPKPAQSAFGRSRSSDARNNRSGEFRRGAESVDTVSSSGQRSTPYKTIKSVATRGFYLSDDLWAAIKSLPRVVVDSDGHSTPPPHSAYPPLGCDFDIQPHPDELALRRRKEAAKKRKDGGRRMHAWN